MRDYRPTDTIRFSFSTNDAAGVPATAAGTVSLFKDGSAVGSALGVTLTPDFAGEVGANRVTIVGATALLTPGSDYAALFEGTVGGVASKQWVREFSVMNQGADVVSRGQLAAVTASGGTLAAGTFARAKAGDAVRILTGASVDYLVMDTLDLGTGVFTFADPWETAPAVGDYYDAVALPRAEKIKAADIADDAISAATLAADAVTAIQAGLATTTEVLAVGVATSDVQEDVNTLSAAVAVDNAAIAAAIAAVEADTQNLQLRIPAALVGGKMDVNVSALDATIANTVADAYLDRVNGVEAGLTPRQAARLHTAILLGLTNGLASAISEFKSGDVVGGAVQGTVTRITGTRNVAGDRTAVAVNLA